MNEYKMSLDNAYKRLNECNITDNNQRAFILEHINIVPAHEIETLLSHLVKGDNIDYIKGRVLPIMEHLQTNQPDNQKGEER